MFRIFWNLLVRMILGLFKVTRMGIPVAGVEEFDGIYNPQTRRHIELVDFILQCGVSRNCRMLDVGSGRGWLAQRFVRAGFTDISGVDWVPATQVQMGGMREYRQINLNDEGLKQFPDQSFDCLVCSDVLEHLENPAQMLREIARVTRQDGDIFITVPNAFNIFERFKILLTGSSGRYNTEQPGEFGHISMLPDNVLRSLMNRAQLKLSTVGKGYCLIAGMILFPTLRFSRLMSYVLYLHLRHADRQPAEMTAAGKRVAA